MTKFVTNLFFLRNNYFFYVFCGKLLHLVLFYHPWHVGRQILICCLFPASRLHDILVRYTEAVRHGCVIMAKFMQRKMRKPKFILFLHHKAGYAARVPVIYLASILDFLNNCIWNINGSGAIFSFCAFYGPAI